MNAWMFLFVCAILVVGFALLIKKVESAILRRGEERVVIFKNDGASARNSTGHIWEETIPVEPTVSLIDQLRSMIDAISSLPEHGKVDWLWVEMVKGHDGERVFVARLAEYPQSGLARRIHGHEHTRTFEATPRPSSGNGDHDHEPVLAGSAADGDEVSASTC
ncbi:MAG: hypothetical protein ACYC5G_05310 [Candidatus Doudnabacteria bacterium]